MTSSTRSDQTFYILGNDMDKEDHAALFAELEKLGYQGKRIHPFEVTTRYTEKGSSFFVNGEEIRPALVLGWVYEDILIPGMYLLTAFERSGIPVVNTAQTLFCGQNKYLNSEALHRHGVPHFPVLSGFSDADLEHFLSDLQFPLVLKPIVGVGGQSVVKIDSKEALFSMAKVLSGFQQSYYVQPYIEKPGRDIRVTCVDYKAVNALYKYSPSGKWITNYASGGRLEYLELTPEMTEIAEKACKAMGAQIGGVDLVEDTRNNTYRVFEVNTCPTFRIGSLLPEAGNALEARIAEFLVATARKHGTIE